MAGSKAEQIDRILAAKLSASAKSPKKVAAVKSPAKKPAKSPAVKSPAAKAPAVKATKTKQTAVPRRVPMIPVLEPRSPPRSPGRSAPISPIRPVVARPRSTGQYGYVPPGRADNLAAKAVIKAIVYGPPPQQTYTDPAILSDISWTVTNPLDGAQIVPDEEPSNFDPNDEYFLPFTDEAKRELNRQFLGYEIYVDVEHIEDPNASAEQEYLEYGGLLHLDSPDVGPLTQWQVLRGLEQYYQWYMARMGGVDALGNHVYFEGLQRVADLNEIPIYRLILGS
jgi:hypothetical protein